MVTAPISASANATKTAIKSAFRATSIPEYWHLLSLDAPTVAIVWSCAFARAAGVALHPISSVLLGVATWLLYVADRLLDGLYASRSDALQERHHFHARHRIGFLAIAFPAACLLMWLVTTRMDRAPRLDDLLLSAAAGIYLLCVHLPARFSKQQGFPKEAAVAIIFSIACVIPAWSRNVSAHHWLTYLEILFAVLCWLNCIAIETWETDGSTARLHSVTRAISRNFRTACIVLAIAGTLLAAVAFAQKQPRFAALAFSVSASALLFLQLDRARAGISLLQLRSAADAVLLTPAVFLLIASIHG